MANVDWHRLRGAGPERWAAAVNGYLLVQRSAGEAGAWEAYTAEGHDASLAVARRGRAPSGEDARVAALAWAEGQPAVDDTPPEDDVYAQPGAAPPSLS